MEADPVTVRPADNAGGLVDIGGGGGALPRNPTQDKTTAAGTEDASEGERGEGERGESEGERGESEGEMGEE